MEGDGSWDGGESVTMFVVKCRRLITDNCYDYPRPRHHHQQHHHHQRNAQSHSESSMSEFGTKPFDLFVMFMI